MSDVHNTINDICYIIAVAALLGILIFVILGDASIINAVKSGTDQDLVNATYFLGVATLFLGLIAISGPFISKWAERTELKVLFELDSPFCHKTVFKFKGVQRRPEPVYYFRLRVENEGRSPAKKCEVVLENLWVSEDDDIPKKFQNFSPVNLLWVTGSEGPRPQYIDINPKRGYFCDIGHISSMQYQREIERDDFNDALGYPSCTRNHSCFMLALLQVFNSQSNYLCPNRKYILEIGLYSENASHQKVFYEFFYSGGWSEDQEEMFKKEIIDIQSTQMPFDL